jgi:hypothetical protein
MTWKTIGQSVAGTSHTATGKPCEDAALYRILTDREGAEVLVCCVSDGAGSALYGGFAAGYTTEKVIACATHLTEHDEELTEGHIYAMAEDIYYGLQQEATACESALDEFSCTLLGCIITSSKSAFFQIGDGAIIRNNGSDTLATVWWPQNGEYHNTTSFLADDSSMSNLRVAIVDDPVDEVALFTDGLQLLALNTENMSVHKPFFDGFFYHLRLATNEETIKMLQARLGNYLNSKVINDRTDDDKTLVLATRINQ